MQKRCALVTDKTTNYLHYSMQEHYIITRIMPCAWREIDFCLLGWEIHGGCSKYLKITVPQNCPQSFHEPFGLFCAPAESGQRIILCARKRHLQEDCFKNEEVKWKHLPESFYRLPDNGNTRWKAFAVATVQNKLDHFGPRWDPGTLAFRQPFVNLPRTLLPVKMWQVQY